MENILRNYSWPIGITLALLTVVVVHVFVVYFAITSEPGLIQENPYQAGLKYGSVITELENAKESGIKTQIDSSDSGLQIKLNGLEEDEAVSSLKLKLIRPDSTAKDKSLVLKPAQAGLFQTSEILAPGLWLSDLSFRLNGKTLRFQQQLFIP